MHILTGHFQVLHRKPSQNLHLIELLQCIRAITLTPCSSRFIALANPGFGQVGIGGGVTHFADRVKGFLQSLIQ